MNDQLVCPECHNTDYADFTIRVRVTRIVEYGDGNYVYSSKNSRRWGRLKDGYGDDREEFSNDINFLMNDAEWEEARKKRLTGTGHSLIVEHNNDYAYDDEIEEEELLDIRCDSCGATFDADMYSFIYESNL